MIKQGAFLCLISALLLTGCATKNDAGVVLHKKPDLTKVTPGTPVNKVAGLKKPIKREVITKGELKGAEAWLYEWDAPNDEVNNKMFTSVVVKDGVIIGYAEDTPDKWRKDRKLHEAAKTASTWEDIAGHMAKAARYQMAANMLANYSAMNASRPRYDPVQASQNFFNYRPWENAQPVNYGMVGNAMASASNRQRPSSVQRIGNMFYGSDGSSVQRIGNQYYGSDGSSAQRIGNQVYGSGGSSSQIIGNQIYRSDGSSSQRIGNQIYHSDGGTTQIIGNTMYNN
jgi:hypothetical protein